MQMTRLPPVSMLASVAVFTIVASAVAAPGPVARDAIDWPAFLVRHDLTWDEAPGAWHEGAFIGNGLLGAMIYSESTNALQWDVNRSDVADLGSRLQIGRFVLEGAGTLKSGTMRLDLWNAELTGTITTDKGSLAIRHLVHSDDMAMIVDVEPSGEEAGFTWQWEPAEAITTRPGVPRTQADIEAFEKRCDQHGYAPRSRTR